MQRLNAATLPPVIEHGDLSDPNLLERPNGGLGVVDWELGAPRGFPLHDLTFFLSYVGLARHRGTAGPSGQLDAFHQTFMAPGAWARPVIAQYADVSGIGRDWVEPLFVACWTRYLAEFCARISGQTEPLSADVPLDWLRRHRFYQFWRVAACNSAALAP
jgi:thiamine kinase-like enzyme